ncbi:carbohydrate kinase family protein [Parafilimonas terrae]|uniref:Sugar or nucleoside kinase, ribokinase family n=1 Tax=Parafilimonas terrae TaxID=1465490 RepID=A0A1I5Y9B0_9BACT|nr:carbohydrate kinase family protein [Parafilimonas terrae]SFQ40507.1 Sugar or nucleoside kinase, ribokinase family [Parafilimonas terrae]
MQDKKFDVLVAGELNIDLILSGLAQFPETGKEILADKMVYTLGSSSAIFASNLSALGVSVNYCGCTGDDDFGKKIIKDLEVKGVATDNIIRSNTLQTGVTVAFNFEQNRAMVTYPGAMNALSENDITDAMLHDVRHLHVSSVFIQPALKPGLVKLFKRAKNIGLTTSLDPQWDSYEKWDCDWKNLLPNVDVFMPNAEELKNITGKENIQDAVASIKSFANIIVVKNSIEGATVFYKNEVIEQPAFINDDFADAIGAGDSFDAGFIRQFIRDKSLKDCTEMGAACGALNTTAFGGTAAFTDLQSVKKSAFKKFNYTIE